MSYCCHYLKLAFTFRSFFFFNDTATTEIYTLSLHDALPISSVKDATELFYQSSKSSVVSIHASVKDATIEDINPDWLLRVSIHASVKDATNDAGVLSGGNLFQSTHQIGRAHV